MLKKSLVLATAISLGLSTLAAVSLRLLKTVSPTTTTGGLTGWTSIRFATMTLRPIRLAPTLTMPKPSHSSTLKP